MRTVFLIVVIAAALFFILRPVLAKLPELHEFTQRVDAKQLSLLSRIRVLVKGVKTKLVARFIGFAGVILPGLQFFDVVDFSTLLPPIAVTADWSIPATMYVPMVLAPALTWVMTALRKATDGPEGVNTFLVEPEKLPDAIIKPETPAAPVFDPGAISGVEAAVKTKVDELQQRADKILAAKRAIEDLGLSWPDMKPATGGTMTPAPRALAEHQVGESVLPKPAAKFE